MKICFLAPANNYHTQKWCHYFVTHGYDVSVISLTEGDIEGVQVYWIQSSANQDSSDLQKILYFTQVFKIKKLINQIAPDILNVHYATSYGTLAALAGLKNYVLSVWGSDIYDFPRRSFLHKLLLKFSLSRASFLFSTSKAMAEETKKYTLKPVYVTPFGVNMNLFNPDKRTRQADGKFIVGTVKKLSPQYGIPEFLQALKLVREQRPEIPLYVRIAGASGRENAGPIYHQMAKDLGIDDRVEWLGFISQEDAAREWANMDCAVVFSQSESFGVSAVEAQATGTALIISDVPGLMEATEPGLTCRVVSRQDVQGLAHEIINLYDNPQVRMSLGAKGRNFVCRMYEGDSCFKRVEDYYHELLHI